MDAADLATADLDTAELQGFLLSPQQQRLWRLQGDEGVGAFRGQCALRLTGEVDREALSRSLDEAAARHEILRTAFRSMPGMELPLQVILDPAPVRLDELDRSAFEEADPEAFDRAALARGDVFRARLVHVAPDEHLLVLDLPALCADLASLEALGAEIAAAYAGSPAAPDAEPPMQYADVADWQNQLLDAEEGAEHLDRWREHWREREIPALLDLRLPLEEPIGEEGGSFAPAEIPVPLPAGLADALARLAGEWEAPLPLVLLAAWQILLRRSTGRPDVLVGVLHDGRRYEELRTAVGPLARFLPIHVHLPETLTVHEAVELACAADEEASRRQERFSWAHLPGRDGVPATRSFFPAGFEAWEAPPVHGAKVSLARRSGVLDRYKLELASVLRGGELEIELRYDPARFRRESVEILAERFRTLLASVAACPEAPIQALDVIGEGEVRRLEGFAVFAAVDAPAGDRSGTIHGLFEQQARRTPDRPAVWHDGSALTYVELDERANRLARRLIGLGVRLETPVAICFERSAVMVVAIFGILKAGGTWVPLDPTHPPERMAFVLDSVRAPLLLTTSSLRATVPAGETQVVCLDEETLDDQPSTSPDIDVPEGAAAYAIYTSGSTGRPKGVMVEHRAAVNLLVGLEASVLPEGSPLKASLNAPLAFDASVQQLVLLLAGHTLYVVPEEVRTDGAALVGFLQAQELDLFDCTPSQLRILLAGGLLSAAGSVPKAVLVAGEPIDEPTWAALAGSERTAFYNIYGPTECTVDATAHRIGTPPAGSIGRPLAGYEVRLLDSGLLPVPIGAPGELVIGGAGLARGYAGRPDLTAERFVPDPSLSGKPGARLYRTGDLARFDPSGHLEFLGRVDNQVKIRGYRIEPGEIEAVLLGHPGVREAVVVPRPGPGEEGAILVAYLIPSNEATSGFEDGELHAFLRQRLPVYMVPSLFIPVPVFPLTGSGKVDRRALIRRPLPERKGRRAGAPKVAPANEAERALVEIWQDVLRAEEISTADNFFQLGGDSILSIQVISRARQRGLHLTARQIFEHQTVAELARVAAAGEVGPRQAGDDGPVSGPVPLTPIQRIYLEQGLVHPEHYNQTLLLEAAPGEERLDFGRLRRALAALLEHHDALRMRFEGHGGETAQRNEPPGGEPPLVEVDLSALPSGFRTVALETAADRVQRSLDLAAGPLLRAVMFHVEPGLPDRFLMVVHHLVVDGVSWRILLEDLENLYRKGWNGRSGTGALPLKTTSFRRWAERLVEHARSEDAEAQVRYWLDRAGTAAPPLPADHETGANTVSAVGVVRVALDADETRRLLQEVPRAYRTQINDVLATALVEAFGGWTGTRRLWLEMEGHGREDVFSDLDVSRTVGWFTTVYPVLLDLDGIDPETGGPGESLKAVKEQLRAVPERGFAFSLMRHLGEEGLKSRLAAVPQPEVIFNYLGQFDQAVAEGRLFRGARESSGLARSEAHTRASLIEVNGSVANGRLAIVWAYSENRHRRGTIEALAGRFLDALRSIVEHCTAPGVEGFTPSDFPLARIDQADLERLLAGAGRVEDVYPATPMQEGLLFHSRLAPRSGAHIGQLNLLFRGAVDPVAFGRAWGRVLERHAVLRTSFFGLDSLLQVVHPEVPVPLEVLDWRDASSGDQRDERGVRLEAYLDSNLRRGFDAATPPLMRLTLIRMEEEAWRFVWLHHHAILDGWSLPILLREFLAFYQDAEAVLERPPAYRDYIAWMVRQDLAAAEAFWRRELAGFQGAGPLGGQIDGQPDDPIFGWVLSSVPAETTDALRALARSLNLTLNTVVQGAWALLLRAFGSGGDVVFGVVTSGRSAPVEGLDAMVGLFVNTLPARVRMGAGDEVEPWLRGIQESQAEQRQLEYSPLVQVQAWSEVPRGLPLFESLLAFENFPVDDSVRERAGQTLGIGEAEAFEQSSYPLALAASPGAALVVKITFDPRRFERADAERRLRGLESLLAGLAVHSGARLSDLSVFTGEERRQLLLGGERGEDLPPEETLAGRIAALARSRPGATAAVLGDAGLTYVELDRRAGALAGRLRRLGVETGDRVGLSVGRSFELLVGLLGIWKAGAAYVPLDPAYPSARLDWMKEDAGLRLVLDADLIADREDGAAELPDLSLELPAYVIYTSGSTGRPKGVVVTHRGLPGLAESQCRLFGIGPESRVLQFASPSFDASVSEIATALWAGATLVLGSDDERMPGPGLVELLRSRRVTVATLPPSALAALPVSELPDLATLVVAGEPCPVDLARIWAAGRRFVNAYGPTETTVCATAGVWDGGGSFLALGRPMAGLEVLLLDAWGDPAPVGVAAELCVAGPGLAQGYLNLPAQTAERFVPHPLSERPGERLYRTGDLARLRSTGELESLGRLDEQVKIRGVRVEPGEVEAVLRAHPAVADAAVIPRSDAAGTAGTVLAAFVVACEPIVSGGLRVFLRERLPEALVPSHYAVLDRLPLSPSGKVDRRALAGLSLETAAFGDAGAPRTPVEELLAGLFAEVLGRERVGADESFFDLGGHSLLATRLTARAQSAFGVDLPLRALFESPSVRALAVRIEDLVRSFEGGEASAAPPLVPVPRGVRGGELPLSFAQERLWFLDQLAPGLATYNMPLALALRGDLSWPALAGALTGVVRRHEVLRTTFAAVDGRPVQVVRPSAVSAGAGIEPPVVDLGGLPEARRWETARALAAEDAARPFDLARGPLLRVALYRLEPALHVAAVNVHHIVYDGWSAGVLVRELGALYADPAARLGSLPVQYGDFAVWQRSWLSGATLDRQLAWWREHLAGAPAVLDLPLDRPRPAMQTFRGAHVTAALTEDVSRNVAGIAGIAGIASVASLARSSGATLFMVLLAAFQALLSRISGQDDVVVGTPVANRGRAETENLIGFFVNTLALRGRLVENGGAPSFSHWLEQVREVAIGGYAHQDIPFEKLVDGIGIERSLSWSPLFQAMLVVQNAASQSEGRLDLPGLTLEAVPSEGLAVSKFDLTLVAAETPPGIAGSWEYNPDLFDRSTIERLAGAFASLLAAAVARPATRLSDLPLLSPDERIQIVAAGFGPDPDADAGLLLHEQFEAWADRQPEAPAVIAPAGTLTYAELDRRANHVARRLRRLGVGPDVLVGICAERSPEMVAGVLGILKAGGAYVPLDPAYPSERLAFLVEDARASVIVTQGALADRLPASSAELLLLDEEESRSRVVGDAGTVADNLAYVIHTSGSTGRPKGVLVPHRGWRNLADAQRRLFGLGPDARVLQFASLSFDASAWEIALAFGSGGALVLGPPERLLSGDELAGLLAQSTVATLPPTALAVLPAAETPQLTTLIVAGEACPPELARRWSSWSGGRRFFNAYGPTESSVCATAALYDGGERLPIGRPIAGFQVCVLDASGELLPPGVPGELCLGGMGGPGLARGYLHLPDRTAERFVPNPYAGTPGERLYRTGDLARWLPDGNLEYLGRIDQQVKVRGFRIEPGEIEAALAALPGVREAVVVVREDAPGDRRLVGYVVPAGQGLDPAALGRLRGELERILPRHAVPSAIVELRALPLTPNGKVDRRALPALERAAGARSRTAPGTDIERILAAVWAEVLRQPEVGVHDNFFELGGDSILSIQVVARAARQGVRITPRQVFEHQTIAGLAVLAGVAQTGGAGLAEEAGPVSGPVALTPIQRWFLDPDPVDPEHFAQSVLLAVRGGLGAETAERALSVLVEHHDALRLRFIRESDGWRQWNASPAEAPPAWERIDLSGLPREEAVRELTAAAARAQSSFDLATGPTVRGLWLDLPDGEARLFLAIHHLSVDGVSWRVLLEDLETLCRGGALPALPPKTTSFQRWAERLALHAPEVEAERAWWLAESRGDSVRLPLARNDREGRNLEASARSLGAALSADETRALLQEMPAAFRTQVNDVLLAALALALAGPGRALRVALEGHGREEIDSETGSGIDLSRTVGWFTTAFPVRLAVPASGGAVDALLSIKEHLRAMPGRGLGFGLLGLEVEWPEVSFNYLGQFDSVLGGDPLFVRAGEPTGPPRSPRAPRAHRLDVTSVVAGGRLRVDWTFGDSLTPATVERLAGRFAESLRELIALGRAAVAARSAVYTPSDFPLARLDTAGLSTVLGGEWGVEDIYPLSPLQEGMLFHTLYHPGSGVYVAQLAAGFEGDLDAALLEEACRRLVRHHPVLRTSFRWEGLVRPLQVVHAGAEVRIEVEDWRAQEIEDRLRTLLRADRERGFDLSRAPIMRWTLIRTGDRSHTLLWSHHHILLDGWSFSAIAGEFLAAYDGLKRGSEAMPPRLPTHRPYRDYIAWLDRQDPAALEAYWRRTLSGWTEPTPLPFGSGEGQGAAMRGLRLGADSTATLQEQARRHQLTLNTLVQAAWAILLGRHAGVEDVVFGATVSGRPADLPGVESMVGLFINTLPVRFSVADGSGGLALLPWLREAQRRQSELLQHEHTPLVDVQRWSELPRGRALFESILVFESYPREEALVQEGGSADSGRLRVADVRAVEQTNYPLTVVAAPGVQLALRIDYDRSRYDGETVARLLGQLGGLLDAMAADLRVGGTARLSELPLLSSEDERQVLIGLDARRSFDVFCLHERFAARAAATPDRIAATFDGESLTYGELDRRTNRVARHLQARGARPESLVALRLERSLEMVVGVLGILKSGAAYLPLDPAYPAERIDFITADSGAGLTVTGETIAEAMRESDEPIQSGAGPESLAYVIYTSGSTGRPKGSLITHANASRLFSSTEGLFGFGEDDVWSLFHSVAFDFSVWEIWGALLYGGRLVVVPWETSRSPEAFCELVLAEGVTVLSQTPSAFRQLLPWLEKRGDGDLRYVVFGGEALEPATLGAWLGREDRTVLPVNMYGITETTVHVTFCPLDGQGLPLSRGGGGGRWERGPGGEDSKPRSPIGEPLPDLWLALLDRRGNPVPLGAPGEIHVGGAGLMRGYLNRPELTAERLIPSPIGAEPGARLYRSGDLARRRPDGELEFLGRADQQVKIRGFRIEPGEIEAALVACPGVEDAAVSVRDDLPGGRALAACVAGKGLSAPDLREALKVRLPDYMVPAHVLILDALPLTVHGKVDRQALSLLPIYIEGKNPIELRSPAEELLAGIFAEVLGREQVGAEDDFFELGGHSLLATQVTSRVRSVFGVELALRELFENPTVRGLAAHVRTGTAVEAPPLVPVPRDLDLPMSFAQERLWFLDQLAPGSAAYNVPLALGLRGALSLPALGAALSALVDRHEALRTTFAEGRQIVGGPVAVPVPVVDLTGASDAEARRLTAAEAARPFDLAAGPVFRALVLRLDDDRHLLLLTLHHIVADGWSLGVLVGEAGELYAAALEVRPASLPALPVQYADFAVWQRSWLTGGVLAAQIAWWHGQLAGAPVLLELPLDRPRPPAQTYRGAHVPVRFSPELSRQLAAWSRGQGATLFMTLLGAFQALLARLSGQDDVVVGTPVANRNRAETERLLGFFVNTLALRGRPRPDLAFPGWIAEVRETALGAYAHQDLPFERLVEELQPERSLAHSPVFQVMLVLQNAVGEGTGQAGLPGLTPEPTGGGSPPVAKFDLTLSLEETTGGLAGSLEHRTDLFDAATAHRFARLLETLIEAAVSRPETPLADLPLLSDPERGELLAAGRGPVDPDLRPAALHELFATQAARTPDAVAVVFGEARLTYRELDEASNRLARHLRKRGVGPETLVALSVDRSLRLVVGILGISKAGGAFVPLDPGLPPARLEMILNETSPIEVTAREPEVGEESGPLDWPDRRDGDTGPDHLAYVIFTSGSTGRPKGVAVPHRGLASLAAAQAALFAVEPGSRVLQFASAGFDASVSEIVVTLAAGATLHLAERARILPGADLAKLLVDEAISVVTLPPSALAVMRPESFPALKTLVVAGEPCPPETARSWMKSGPRNRRFVNAYGPTEATVCATAEIVTDADRITVGRPIDGAEAFVLDRRMEPVPPGVPGDLYLAGPGLARGYLRRPDLTAEAFLPHPLPHPGLAGARLYRSGDLARTRPDGRIELLGRADRQVKIRGFRVELDEVEAVLGSCPAVIHAVALAVDGNLVAYVVPRQGLEAPVAELRLWLAERLPSYMAPSSFVALAGLPMLPSGKPDRKALAAITAIAPQADTTVAIVEPRSPIETTLAEIFAQVLRIERIGITEDFFARGGHSLLAVSLVSRIEERLGRRLPLAVLFEGATVEKLAALLSRPATIFEQRALVALQPLGFRPPFFCVHPIGGGVTGYYANLVQSLGKDQPFYGLQAVELDSRDGAVDASIEAIAARYLVEVRAARPSGPYRLGGASYGGLVAFEMARQLLEAGEEVAFLGLIDTLAPRSIEDVDAEEPVLIDDAEQSVGMAQALARMYGKELDLKLDDLRDLPLEEMLGRVLAAVQAVGLAGPEIDVPWLLRYRETFNARILGTVRYRARPYPGKLVLFRSSDLGDPSPEALERIARAYDWQRLAASVDVRWIPGDHETMLIEPNVRELALSLTDALNDSTEATEAETEAGKP